jgi:hypothetical protein
MSFMKPVKKTPEARMWTSLPSPFVSVLSSQGLQRVCYFWSPHTPCQSPESHTKIEWEGRS